MAVIRYDHSNQISDIYYVEDDVAVNEGDVMVLSGGSITSDPAGTKYGIVPFVSGGYALLEVCGVALTSMASDYPNRDDITLVLHGIVKVTSGGAGTTINRLQKGVLGEAAVEDCASGEWHIGRALETATSGNKVVMQMVFGHY